MFRWNGGTASFKKKLLRKMPDKNNKIVVSKYFPKNHSKKTNSVNQQENTDEYDYSDNIEIVNMSTSKIRSINDQNNEKSYIPSSKNFPSKQEIEIMIEPLGTELSTPTFSEADILMLDPTFIKAFGSQETNEDISSSSSSNNMNFASVNKVDKIHAFHHELKNEKPNKNPSSTHQYDISNHIIFDRNINLLDTRTQTQP